MLLHELVIFLGFYLILWGVRISLGYPLGYLVHFLYHTGSLTHHKHSVRVWITRGWPDFFHEWDALVREWTNLTLLFIYYLALWLKLIIEIEGYAFLSNWRCCLINLVSKHVLLWRLIYIGVYSSSWERIRLVYRTQLLIWSLESGLYLDIMSVYLRCTL